MVKPGLGFMVLAGVLLIPGCTPSSPNDEVVADSAHGSHPSGDQIALRWEVVDNHKDGSASFTSALTLVNEGAVPLGSEGWALYFNFVRMIFPESLPASVQITHINGDFFRLVPTEAFAPLAPGDSLRLEFNASNWAISESDAPTGFYFVFTDGPASAIQPVTEVTVASFVSEQQTDRFAGDLVPVSTPALRYEQNQSLTLLPADQVPRIVPTPVTMTQGTGTLMLDASLEIHHAAGLEAEAAYLAAALELLLGDTPRVVEDTTAAANAIVLRVAEVNVDDRRTHAGDEAYRLTVDAEDGVDITGTDQAGVFYGIQSLRALLPVAVYRQAQRTIPVDAVMVEDVPRFRYRGMHLDVARNFQPKDAVEKLLDLMAFYKLNTFHFHLTDDEGWRLEIEELPALTEVGGRRGHTLDEQEHLMPSLGSGPDPTAAPGSGYYTRADFIDILRYARARHIEVIPEIDVPGHARAAIKAMEARATRLTAQGREEEASAYLLRDPEDTSEYQSIQRWNDNVVDVCREATYHFLETVVDDIVEMYAEAHAPLTTIHTGGDEVPRGAWEQSPACERLIATAEEVEGVDDLSGYFLRRVSDILDERGLTTAGWEEIALKEEEQNGTPVKVPNEAFVGRQIRPYVWNTVWGWGGEENAYRLANAGYDVVLSNASSLYFDLAYDKDPKEPGFYWAGFTDTREVYAFAPFDLYQGAREDLMGNPIDPAAYSHHMALTKQGRQHILGLQGQLWGETIKHPDRIEYMAVPRLLALAERAWAPQPTWVTMDDAASAKYALDAQWNVFANTVGQRELPRLDDLFGGVNYRLPVPGAVREGSLLKANVAFPGLTIRYTTDGSEPTTDAPRYTEPVPVSAPVKLKTFDTLGRGSRTVVVPSSNPTAQ